MELLFITIAVIVIIVFVNYSNTAVVDAIRRLELKIRYLEEQISHAQQSPVASPAQEIEIVDEPLYEAVASAAEETKMEEEEFQPDFIYTEEIEDEQPAVESIDEENRIEPPVFAKKPAKKAKNTDFEKFIGENLLSKIGIATLVLGIGYFVKYAIDQNWINEIGRVALGVLCGGAIIAIAHKLKTKYRTFSSILVGGGISILYITITIAFRDYQIFSQPLAFVLLILITVFSVFLSLWYDRKELAIFSLLGGFVSPLMVSSGTGNYIVLFSYILILNAGMLVLAFKKQWRILGTIAYVLTQLFYWVWLLLAFKDEYVGATCFILLFYLQFYLLALIDHYKSNRTIQAFHSLIILSNNLFLFGALLLVFDAYPIDLSGTVTIGIAVLNAIPLIILFKDKTVDKRLIYMLIGVVLTFVSLAIPVQLHGCAITMFWAVEAVLLLWLWQKSDISIFRTGFFALQGLVIVSLLMDWVHFYAENVIDGKFLSIIINAPFITGIVIILTVWTNAYLLKKDKKEIIPGYAYLNRVFSVAGGVLLFFTLFWELQYQMVRFYEVHHFRLLIYGLYFYLFTAALTVICWNKIFWKKSLYIGIIASVVSCVLIYIPIVVQVRADILLGHLQNWGYLSMHYLVLPGIVLFFVFLIQNRVAVFQDKDSKGLIYWLITIVSVVILSVEADNLLFLLFYTGKNQIALLNTSHNIIYPILWGTTSFVLIIIGMKYKIRTLRIIALSLFALIIAKLYLYDIWQMGQTGRIVALVFLGILLLVVSFLYQKLKVLLKKEEEEELQN